MESTGIVRRIDELGRIVIPKEIRRTLKIKDGSSLEIFIEKDMVTLKKFSSMSGLIDIAEPYTDAIFNVIKKTVIVTDRDSIIAVAGKQKKELIGLSISKYLEECLNSRNIIVQKYKNNLELSETKTISCSYVIRAIVSHGDSVGLVIILDNNDITDSEEDVVTIAAQFLGKHIEE